MGLSTALSIGGSIASGLIGSKSAKSAASASAAATDAAIAEQRAARQQARSDLTPFRETGVDAVNFLKKIFLDGGTLDPNLITKSPGFQFRKSEGEKALNNAQIARGNLLSGRGIKEALRFNQDFASNEFGNFINRIFGLSEQGRGAASASAGVSTGSGNAIASLLANQGNTEANAILNASNATRGGISSGINNYLALDYQNRFLDRIRPGA